MLSVITVVQSLRLVREGSMAHSAGTEEEAFIQDWISSNIIFNLYLLSAFFIYVFSRKI